MGIGVDFRAELRKKQREREQACNQPMSLPGQCHNLLSMDKYLLSWFRGQIGRVSPVS
jgi:hypothetical protein